ncbi:hypothetical protein GCM10023165_20260 [Variovorax defluvii]|uniref:Uncharacterized protein n=2 Tax=Variovorax defluvii TaxID=913761 RepID=A0ABP8HJT5_9BURK
MPAYQCSLFAVAFGVCAAGGLALAGEWERERDAMGLYKEPVCDFGFRVKSALTNIAKQHSTGVKATTAQWEMEVFNNPDSKSWTLVGKSKAPDASPNKLCRLSGGQQSPYDEQPWFKEYFGMK